jgi:DNA-binding NtrC family response regulator
MKIFCRHAWPGNVRELEHVLEYCFVFTRGPVITERSLPTLDSAWSQKVLEWTDENLSPLETAEKQTILQALERASGKKEEAARLLKISRSKLWRKMKIYEINEDKFKKERDS